MSLCETIKNLKPYERLIIIDPDKPIDKNVAFVERDRDRYKVLDGSIRHFDSHVLAGAAAIEKVSLPQKTKWKVIDLRR